MSHLANELSGAIINDDINKVINDTVVNVTPPVQNKINFGDIKGDFQSTNSRESSEGTGKTLGISPLLDSIFDVSKNIFSLFDFWCYDLFVLFILCVLLCEKICFICVFYIYF